MRLWGLLPVSLLSVVCECTQLPIEAQRVTLVDVLSANSQYSSLLQLLQRTRLLPTLNKLRNATLFAPTNAALSGTMALYDDSVPDNVQAALRRQLLYHLVNSNDTSQPPQLIETLLFPHPKAGEGAPGNPPDSGGEPDGHSLLGGEGQKLEWSKADSVWHLRSNDQQANVLGSNITRAGNGLVLPVDHLLQTPKSVSHVLLEHPLLSQIRSLCSTEQLEEYATRANLTLFVPVDKAWEGDALDELEWKYLRSGFAQKDLLEVFQNHAASSTIAYAGRLAQQKTSTLRTCAPSHP
jgi:solute carrier family 25 carnitine/acylcarnitine transporter 20/29